MSATAGSAHYQDFADGMDVVAARPIEVLALRATNANAAARYLQLHNVAVALSGAEAPQFSVLVPAGSAAAPAVLDLRPDWFNDREVFTVGCVYAFSTTAATYTAATDGDHTIAIRYRG